MILYNHQREFVASRKEKWNLFWQTGTGKTLAAIEMAKSWNTPTLIVCPKMLKTNWENLTVTYGNWKVVSKEEFRRDVKILKAYPCLVIDELHYFLGHTSLMHKSLIWYLKEKTPKYFYGLTATPYMSSAWNVYALMKVMGTNVEFWKFRIEFFNEINMGGRRVPVQKAGIEDKLQKIIKRYGSMVKLEDCVDVPEQTFETEYFSLTKEQETIVNEVKLSETNHITKWTKIHQVCGGTLKGDGYIADRQFKAEKLERIMDLTQSNLKMIVVCRYLSELNLLEKTLKENTTKKVYRISGEVKDRQGVIDTVNDAKECVLLVQASCSEGWETPDIGLMVFYSLDFSLKNYIQMQGRISRINAVKKNFYLHLVVKGSIDQEVKASMDKKKDFQINLYRV